MRTSKIRIRILCLLLCLAVLVPCASALGETTKVAAYLLRLRAGPSTNDRVLDAYPRGTVVTILRKGGTWTKVRVHGKEGYMLTSMLSYGRGKSSTDTGNTANTQKTTNNNGNVTAGSTAYVVKGVRLNLRETAEAGSPVIGSFRGGTKVTVIRKGRYWSFVEVKGLQGYMWNEFLTTGNE